MSFYQIMQDFNNYRRMGVIKPFICLKSSNPLDLSHKNPRVKCLYFTEAIAASVNTDFFQEEKSWRKGTVGDSKESILPS